MPIQPTVVWTEIPVTDLAKASEFYGWVFDWDMSVTKAEPNDYVNFNSAMEGVGGHLYPGTPGQGATIHLALPGSLEEGMTRCTEAGGTLVGDPITIPPGRFIYASDPDGNSIGLFETKAA